MRSGAVEIATNTNGVVLGDDMVVSEMHPHGFEECVRHAPLRVNNGRETRNKISQGTYRSGERGGEELTK